MKQSATKDRSILANLSKSDEGDSNFEAIGMVAPGSVIL